MIEIGATLPKWPSAWHYRVQRGARFVEMQPYIWAKFERVDGGWRRTE